jgi:hypothetical protein
MRGETRDWKTWAQDAVRRIPEPRVRTISARRNHLRWATLILLELGQQASRDGACSITVGRLALARGISRDAVLIGMYLLQRGELVGVVHWTSRHLIYYLDPANNAAYQALATAQEGAGHAV